MKSTVCCFRYGVHVSNNSYYLCYSPTTIKNIFNRIRTLDNGQVSKKFSSISLEKNESNASQIASGILGRYLKRPSALPYLYRSTHD